MKILTIGFILAVSGCATQYVPVAASLDCPDPLILEKADFQVKAKINVMKAHDPELYQFFFDRAELQRKRRETLQSICRSTHEP